MLSFILLVVTSVVLYIVPQGRVAFWMDWRLWGLTKVQWSNIHITTGLLFIISIFLHIYYNWKPMMAYLKNRACKTGLFNINFNIALLVTFSVVMGTYFQVPPMSSVIQFGEEIKQKANVECGAPPYGHAELSSLKTFVSKLGLDLNKSRELLEKAGIKFESETHTIKEIALKNGITPQQMYEVIKPKSPAGAGSMVWPDKAQAALENASSRIFARSTI